MNYSFSLLQCMLRDGFPYLKKKKQIEKLAPNRLACSAQHSRKITSQGKGRLGCSSRLLSNV